MIIFKESVKVDKYKNFDRNFIANRWLDAGLLTSPEMLCTSHAFSLKCCAKNQICVLHKPCEMANTLIKNT